MWNLLWADTFVDWTTERWWICSKLPPVAGGQEIANRNFFLSYVFTLPILKLLNTGNLLRSLTLSFLLISLIITVFLYCFNDTMVWVVWHDWGLVSTLVKRRCCCWNAVRTKEKMCKVLSTRKVWCWLKSAVAVCSSFFLSGRCTGPCD